MKGLSLGMDANIESGSVKFYVSKGVLSGILSNMKLSGTISLSEMLGTTENITATFTSALSMTVKCTDYGTTVVTKPAEIA